MKLLFFIIGGVALIVVILLYALFPPLGANALLLPYKVSPPEKPPEAHEVTLEADNITLRGWHFKTPQAKRGTIIYLHGVCDNKGSSLGVAKTFVPKGFDVIAYDSRAHGDSGGEFCTYGYHEKEDLKRIIAGVAHEPIFIIGTSMGAAIALQAAPDLARVNGIITIDIFSDLETVVRDRMPPLISNHLISLALKNAEKKASFIACEVSPLHYAQNHTIPCLILHGAEDKDTPPAHSKRVYNGLKGEKEFFLIEGAAHAEAGSRPETWKKISAWIEERD